jgi:hypothetical protein
MLVYVVILPDKGRDDNLTQKVASIIGKDLYGTRLLLSGRVPKIVARYDSIQAADLTSQSLKGLGLNPIICQDSELRKPSQWFRAHSLQFEQSEITFSNKTGQSVTTNSEDVLMVLCGKVETRESVEVTKTKMKLNLPVTLLTGGIPIRRKITEKTVETDVQNERFMRLYTRESHHANIEIRQYDFNYSCLQQKSASISTAIFDDLTLKIRELFPAAVYDDRLTGNYGLALPYITPWENIDILSGLIYFFTRSTTQSG